MITEATIERVLFRMELADTYNDLYYSVETQEDKNILHEKVTKALHDAILILTNDYTRTKNKG